MRRTCGIIFVLAVLLVSTFLLLPQIPDRRGPKCIFHKDFEKDLSDWFDYEAPDRMYITDQVAYIGSHSLQVEFRPGDRADRAGWIHRHFFPEHWPWSGEGPNLETAGVEEVYVRLYERWSENFHWCPDEEGPHNIYLGAGDFDSPTQSELTVYLEIRHWHPMVMILGGHHGIDYTVWEAERPRIELGRWYCFEIRVKMNEPGQSNGIIQLWVDGELVLDIHDAYMRHSRIDLNGNILSFHRFMIGPYYHGGVTSSETMYIWIDEITVSTYPPPAACLFSKPAQPPCLLFSRHLPPVNVSPPTVPSKAAS